MFENPHHNEKFVQKKLFTISDLIFTPNSDVLNKKYEYLLQKIINFLRSFTDAYVIVEVHTDNQSTESFNIQMSMARAKTIMDHIIKYTNINPENIEIYGYGDTRPIAPNDTPENMQKNRRVEITIFYSGTETDAKVPVENLESKDVERANLIELNELIELVQYAAVKYDIYFRVKGKRLKELAKIDADEAEYLAKSRAKKSGYKIIKRVVTNETFMYELLSLIRDLNNTDVWKRIYSAWNGQLVEPSKLHRGQAVFVLYK